MNVPALSPQTWESPMPEPTVPDLRTAAEPPPVVTYTNWRGEMAERRIIPQRLWYGATDWHPTPGWLLDAFDVDRSAMRSFSLDGLAEDTSLTLASGSAPDPQGADEPSEALFMGAVSLPGGGVPDEPGDDDLTAENRKLREALADAARDFGKERAKRFEIAAELRDALAEVERLRAAAPRSEDGGWLKACIADELDDYLPDAVAYQWADPIAREVVHRLPHVFAGQLTAAAIADAIDEAQRLCAGDHQALDAEHLAALAAGVAQLLRAGSPPPTPAPTREQVAEVIAGNIGRDCDDVNAAADAVMALWSAEPAPPLWTGTMESLRRTFPDLIGLPPGTAVEIREVPR
jgi:hypothetical protein